MARQWAAVLLLALAAALAAPAQAETYRFTATSASAGPLGYLDADATGFTPGDAFQFVPNSALSGLDFSDPLGGLRVTMLSPQGEGAVFDSSGALPVLALGLGLVGGIDFDHGLWLLGEHVVVLGTSTYDDVVWSTGLIAAVPEPKTAALWIAGLLALGRAGRRRQAAGNPPTGAHAR